MPQEEITMFTALKNYAVFTGRARRKEFWMFALLNILITICFYVCSLMGAVMGEDGAFIILIAYILLTLWNLAALIPGIAVTVRRLHDIGKSGWFYLLHLIPCGIGSLILLVFMCKDSQPGDNQYGPNPKGN